MNFSFFRPVRAALLAAAFVGLTATAPSATQLQSGVLECNVAPGVGFIIGSSKNLTCVFHPARGRPGAQAEADIASPSPSSPPIARFPGTGNNTDFEAAPEPDYLALLSLYMASNADILNNPAFAWENMISFHIAEGKQKEQSKECFELFNAARNEFDLNRLVEKAKSLLETDLATVRTAPKTRIFKLRQRVSLGKYDSALGGFLFNKQMVTILGGEVAIARTAYLPNHGYDGRLRSLCNVHPNGMFNDLAGRELLPNWHGRGGMALRVESQDDLKVVPMQPSEADSFLARQKSGPGGISQKREADVEVLVEAGPAIANPSAPGAVPAHIIAARLKDPVTGATIHTFKMDPQKSAPFASTPPAANGSKALPLWGISLHCGCSALVQNC